jgi:uncharacterized protein (DUF362 family)
MKKLTRRDAIRMGVGTIGALGAASFLPRDLNAYPFKNSTVAAVRGDDLMAMTRDALDALGGMNTIIEPGDTVFIKPNFVSFPWAKTNRCFHAGECTKPEIIITVIEECLKAGAVKVIVGEGSHLPTFDWQYAITLDGRTDLRKEARRLSTVYPGSVSLACLETASPSWTELPTRTRHGHIAVSTLAATADKIISIPVAKTHSWAQVTLAAKNFIGITPLSRYAQLVDNTWWNRGSFDHSSPRAIARVYLDIVRGLKPDLSIIDFSIGIEGDGPTRSWGGRTIDMKERIGSWGLIASTDMMAADATAVRIMDHDPAKIAHLAMGSEMGLGEIQDQAINIVGENIDNLRSVWKPAELKG